MSVNIIVDGKKIEAPEGALLIDVCRENGIHIPHFCYHPGLGPDGNCRMCQVEFVSDRGNRLGISCNTVVAEGMEVLTQSDAVKAARASVEEMLLLNHPLDCPICDKAGECTLQDYYMAHDLRDSRQGFERYKKKKALDIGPTLVLDQQRCVLCDRCVRFLRDVAGEEQLFIAGRAHEAYLTTFPGKVVDNPYSLNVVDLCPVGALTAKDFRFASPTWFLKRTPSVCVTCSRGCSTEVNSKRHEVHRVRPRHNPAVNGYWMCDEGRLNYKFVNKDRYDGPKIKRGGELAGISYEEAWGELKNVLSGGKVAVLVSATCTLEEMYLAGRLAGSLKVPVYAVRHVPDGVEDDLLRKADRHPNTRGARLLGMNIIDLTGEPDAGAVAAEGDVGGGTVLCVGFNYGISAGLERLVTQAAKVVTLSACESSLGDRADLIIPGLTFAEKDGLLVNFEGHIQCLNEALDHAPWTAPMAQAVRSVEPPRCDWKTLSGLLAALGDGDGTGSLAEIRASISKDVAAFGGIDLTEIGPCGVRLEGQPVE